MHGQYDDGGTLSDKRRKQVEGGLRLLNDVLSARNRYNEFTKSSTDRLELFGLKDFNRANSDNDAGTEMLMACIKSQNHSQQLLINKSHSWSDDEVEKWYNACGELLHMNPELPTVFNFRRQLLFDKLRSFVRQSHSVVGRESQLWESACGMVEEERKSIKTLLLARAQKSYCVWHARLWILSLIKLMSAHGLVYFTEYQATGTISRAMESVISNTTEFWDRNVREEFELCRAVLKLDDRNFHCWDHRDKLFDLWLGCSKGQEIRDEMNFKLSEELLSEDFSNGSAWHCRLRVADLPSRVSLADELNFIKDALIVQPADESVHTYLRWMTFESPFAERRSTSDVRVVIESPRNANCAQRVLCTMRLPEIVSILHYNFEIISEDVPRIKSAQCINAVLPIIHDDRLSDEWSKERAKWSQLWYFILEIDPATEIWKPVVGDIMQINLKIENLNRVYSTATERYVLAQSSGPLLQGNNTWYLWNDARPSAPSPSERILLTATEKIIEEVIDVSAGAITCWFENRFCHLLKFDIEWAMVNFFDGTAVTDLVKKQEKEIQHLMIADSHRQGLYQEYLRMNSLRHACCVCVRKDWDGSLTLSAEGAAVLNSVQLQFLAADFLPEELLFCSKLNLQCEKEIALQLNFPLLF